MQASRKCGALSQSSTTWEQIHVFVWAQLAHEQTLSQGNECLKRWGRAHTLFLKYLGKTDMLTENKACLLKKKREKKIEFLSSNKTTYSLHTRTMLCICWLHFSRSRIKSSYLFSPLSGTWLSVSSGSHTHTCGPAALGQRPPLLASLSPFPGRKGCSLWFHGVCFPCTHTVLSWSPEQMDSRNKKTKSTEAKQTSKESREKPNTGKS